MLLPGNGTPKNLGQFSREPSARGAARGGTVGALLRGAREAAVGGMAHAALPLQLLAHEELPRRAHDASRNPVFQAMLAWGDADERALAGGGGATGGGAGGAAFGPAVEVEPELEPNPELGPEPDLEPNSEMGSNLYSSGSPRGW